ncbi:hypothetical protein A3Q56_01512 [Intoshia linei]|uniref:Uncharacterized protein n=1 Tax=Intoshia linei TaxID=1819745 RepID=A0A177BAQ4_9BILA|nr:hypothetical protein A3Q56_01512 [Intoshia linei]
MHSEPISSYLQDTQSSTYDLHLLETDERETSPGKTSPIERTSPHDRSGSHKCNCEHTLERSVTKKRLSCVPTIFRMIELNECVKNLEHSLRRRHSDGKISTNEYVRCKKDIDEVLRYIPDSTKTDPRLTSLSAGLTGCTSCHKFEKSVIDTIHSIDVFDRLKDHESMKTLSKVYHTLCKIDRRTGGSSDLCTKSSKVKKTMSHGKIASKIQSISCESSKCCSGYKGLSESGNIALICYRSTHDTSTEDTRLQVTKLNSKYGLTDSESATMHCAISDVKKKLTSALIDKIGHSHLHDEFSELSGYIDSLSSCSEDKTCSELFHSIDTLGSTSSSEWQSVLEGLMSITRPERMAVTITTSIISCSTSTSLVHKLKYILSDISNDELVELTHIPGLRPLSGCRHSKHCLEKIGKSNEHFITEVFHNNV